MSKSKEQQIRESWTDNAAAWTESVRKGRIESRVLVTDQAVVSAVRAVDAARVLDVGCGEGWLCRALQQFGIETVGFDATPELVERARASGAGAYHVLSYERFVADPRALGSGYDAAVCNFSLLGECVEDVLRAMAAVVRPGGVVIVQTVHPFPDPLEPSRYEDGWRVEDFRSLGSRFPTPMPWYFRTVGSWIRALAAAGLQVRDVTEPLHPENGRPVALLFTTCRPDPR